MKAPKILPWIAKKAGISEELALKLWRRAASEAEHLTCKAEGSEYWGLAVERFLSHVEGEALSGPAEPSPPVVLDVAASNPDVPAIPDGSPEHLPLLAKHLAKHLHPAKGGLTSAARP